MRTASIGSTATFATGKNRKVKKKLAKQYFDFLMTKRRAGFTSMRMEQIKALATVASLPSSKVLLI